MIREVDETGLQAAMKGNALLVYFSATWCGPCKVARPQVQRAVQALGGAVDAVSADIDQCPKAVRALGLTKVPTVMLVKSGVEVARRSGVTSQSEIVAMVQQHLTRR